MMMNKHTTTGPTFEQDLATARRLFEELGPFTGEHPEAAKAFLDATDHDGRQAAVYDWEPGRVRRGFREMALRLERKGDQANADVFWALRDDIDPADGEVFVIQDEEA